MKYYVGIDLGGTNIVAGVVDGEHNIIGQSKVKTDAKRGEQAVIKSMADCAFEAVKNANLTMEQMEWVGIGCPGTIDPDTGVVIYSNNIEWENVPLKSDLEKLTGKPIYINNDANAAAYGEYIAGVGKDADSLIMVTLGTGVGGGIILDNQIYSGANCAGGELGHSVITVDGRACTCGRNGCLEAYASATGLITTTIEAMNDDKSSKLWELCGNDINAVNGVHSFDAMRAGDATGKKVVDTYIKQLACGITNIINTFQPEILCIGGGICNEKDTLLNPLKELVAKEVYTRLSKKNTDIVIATLANDAGVIGAAMLGFAK